MSASTRRAALGAILAAPLASVPAAAADPHVAREAQARAIWRHHRDTDHGLNEPDGTPANDAAEDAVQAVWEFANEACRMPRPTTLAGLGVLAMSLALADEEYASAGHCDQSDTRYITLLEAVLSVSGIAMPTDHRGLVYRPQEDERCA